VTIASDSNRLKTFTGTVTCLQRSDHQRPAISQPCRYTTSENVDRF